MQLFRQVTLTAKHPAKVRLIEIDEVDRVELYERNMVIEVPLTISRATLQRQFKKLLAEQHEGRLLNIAATGTKLLTSYAFSKHISANFQYGVAKLSSNNCSATGNAIGLLHKF